MMLAIDIETTGLDWRNDRIVEVAAVWIDESGRVREDPVHEVVNPDVEIPTAASDIHGITTELAQKVGADPFEALTKVADAINSATRAGVMVVAYNAKFDIPFLLAEFDRYSRDFRALPLLLDPMVVDKHVDRYRRGSRKLIDVAKLYGVELAEEDAHGALADATAAGQLAVSMCRSVVDLKDTRLGIHLKCVHWAEQQRQSFVDYRRQQGDRGFDIPAGWPIPSGVAA